MGYTTDFHGEFRVEPPLTPEQTAYLKQFQETRRMARDAAIAERLPDPLRLAVGLPIGYQGAYFVGGEGFCGQADDASVLCHNTEPGGCRNRYSNTLPLIPEVPDQKQPGLWCQWVPSDDGTTLAWDEGEKFYYYTEWLEYIVRHFLIPWGRTINGEVRWQGEENDDRGVLYAVGNVVTAVADEISNPGPG